MNNIEYQGFWWLPSNPDESVAGILTFKPSERIELQLIGALGKFGRNQEPVNQPIILGIVKGNIITLSDCVQISSNYCVQISSNLSRPGYTDEQYRVKFAFLGKHFQNTNEMLFNEVSIQSTYLSDWVDLPPIKRSLPEHTNQPQQITFIYNQPESIKANFIEGEVSVEVSVFYGWKDSGKLYDIDFKQLSSISIKTNKELPFEDLYHQYIRPILDFLTFATGKPNSVEKIHFPFRNNELKLIEMLLLSNSIESKKILSPDDLLFSLADIKPEFSLILQLWFNSYKELGSIFNLIFSIQYKPDMYLENKFLNIAQAAESYHRRKFNNQVLPKSEHEAKIEALLNHAPEEHKQWLKEKLLYSNEPSLQDRLIDLLKRTEMVINPLVKDHLAFARKVKNTRNYFTHWNTSLKDKVVQGEELFRITQTLLFMLQSCLLMELGCSPERCAELIGRNKEYQYAISQISKTN